MFKKLLHVFLLLSICSGTAFAQAYQSDREELKKESLEHPTLQLLKTLAEQTAQQRSLANITFDLEDGIPSNAYYRSSGNYGIAAGDSVTVSNPFYRTQATDTTYLNGYSFRSGDISQNEASNRVFVVKVASGGGTLQFRYKLSTEDCCDFLRVELNGQTLGNFSGEQDWILSPTYTLPEGEHLIDFWFFKNGSVDGDIDAVFIDDISITNADNTPTQISTITPAASAYNRDINIYGTGFSTASNLNRLIYTGADSYWYNSAQTEHNLTVQVPGSVDPGNYEVYLDTPYGTYYYPDVFTVLDNTTVDITQENTLSASSPLALTKGDFNEDGTIDIAYAGNTGGLYWYAGNGDGTFGTINTISSSLGNSRAIKAGDIDNDGDLDIVATTYTDSEIIIFENLGNGSFSGGTIESTTAQGTWGMDLGDFNQDGYLDIVVGEYVSNTVSILLNNGSGAYGSEVTLSGTASNVREVQATDFDNDGDLDILATLSGGGQFTLYENNGNGSFASASVVLNLSTTPTSGFAYDFNNDGRKDIIATSQGDHDLVYYENTGSGYTANTLVSNAGSPQYVNAADINGDGNLDILYSSIGTDQLFYLLNNGNGGFLNPVPTPSPIADSYIHTTADVDNNGVLDIISAEYGGGTITVSLNTGNSNNSSEDLTITSITPDAAAPGSDITIYGTGFSSTASSNTVEFGNTSGAIQSASANKLVVEVPSTSAGITDIAVTVNENTATLEDGFVVLRPIEASFSGNNILSSTANSVRTVYSADLDGDGDFDVISASFGDNKVAWYENNGNGSFQSESIISSTANGVQEVYAADMDNDGDVDVIASLYSANSLVWYENNGDGTFQSQSTIASSVSSPFSIYASDFDGDGYLDVVASAYSTSSVAWYKNNGNGTFQAGSVINNASGGSYGVYASDLDNDGDSDIMVASYTGNRVSWYENNGNGSFQNESVISNSANGPWSIHAADLDNDGDNDLLYSSYSDSEIVWHRNNGDGTFQSEQVISNTVAYPRSAYAADMNGDGNIDVLAASYSNDAIYWYQNNGNGDFQEGAVISNTVNGAHDVHPSDLDGDGDLDVISAAFIGDQVIWHENVGEEEIDLTSIADARQLSNNTEVTIRGMITRSYGNVHKIQQGNAGLHLFSSGSVNPTLNNANLAEGDSVQITGLVGDADGMRELSNISDVRVLSSGNALPDPIYLSLNQVSDFEQYESVLIYAEGLSTGMTEASFQQNLGYSLLSNGALLNNLKLMIGSTNSTEVVGQPIPELFTFTGVISESSNQGHTLYPINEEDITRQRVYELQSIADAKNRNDGDTVKVRGIATTPNLEPGSRTSFFIQDNGVGINIFKFGTPIKEISIGDSIEVVGEITTFNGLREIVVDDLNRDIQIINSDNELPAPRVISYDEFTSAGDTTTDVLNLQGRLVRINGLTTTSSTWPANSSASSTNIVVNDFDGNSYATRLNSGTEVIGVTPPLYMDMIGVLGSYNGTQFMPRFEDDLIEIDQPAPQSLIYDAGSSSISLSWEESPLAGMDGYNVYRSTSAFTDSTNATKLNSSLVTTTNFIDNAISENTTYYYRVSAYDRDNGQATTLSNQANVNFKVYSIYAADRTFGDPQTEITLYGTNLSSTTSDYTISIGSGTATVSNATANSVTVQIPSIAPGTYPITVALNGDDIAVNQLITVLEDEIDESGYFQKPVELATSLARITSIALPDLNGDDDHDILASLHNTSSTTNLVWLENEGTSANFTSSQTIGDANDSGARNTISADFDNDGDLDVAAAYDRVISWYENDDAGNFSSHDNSTIAILPSRTSYDKQTLLAFDVDGDANVDLIHANRLEQDITYYRNIGGGEFVEEELIDANASLVNNLFAGDIDGDGDLDIIASLESTDQIVSYINNSGSFDTAVELTAAGDSPQALSLADFDNDGDQDLIVVHNGDHRIAWYTNNSGSFATQNLISQSVQDPISIAAADMNGDDLIDIVVGTEHGEIVWFENQEAGSFSSTPTATLVSDAGEIRSIAIGDLDDDGRLDVVAGDYTNGNLLYLRNVDTPPAAPTGVTIARSIGEIELSWDANTETDLDGYNILRSTHPDSAFTTILNVRITSTSYIDTDITNGFTYYYKIEAIDETGTRVESDVVSIRAISTQIATILPLAGTPGSSVILRGVGFSQTSSQNQVTFGSTAATILDSDSASIRVQVPNNVSGQVDITVASEGKTSTYPAPFLVLNENEAIFREPETETGFSGSGNIISTDIDGNGTGDLVATRPQSNQISMFFSDGQDPLSRTLSFNFASSVAPSVIRPTNIYGEDYPDFVFISNVSNEFRVMKNNGQATSSQSFIDQHTINVSHVQLSDIFTADMNEDGISDVILASRGDDKISWYANESTHNEDVSFGSEVNISQHANDVRSIFAADFNGDNLTDVVAALADTNHVMLYENNGDSTFSTIVLSDMDEVTNPVKVYGADLDSDGDIDVISASDNRIIAYENDGNGNFNSISVSTAIGEASDVIAADINGDGALDIVATSLNNDAYYWYENTGDFSFSNGVQLPGSYNGAYALTAYDADENGQLDLAVRGLNDGLLGVAINIKVTGLQVQNVIAGTDNVMGLSDDIEIQFDTNLDELNNAEAWFQNAISLVNDDGNTFTLSNLTYDGSSIIIESEDLYSMDTLHVSISTETMIQNSDGQLYLDVNENGVRDANDGDYNSEEFYTTLIGDFDLDGDVDFDDLTQFSDGWRNDNYAYETGPINFGGTLEFPNAYLITNNNFDIDDLVIFIRFWNYSQELNQAQQAKQLAVESLKSAIAQNNGASKPKPGLKEHALSEDRTNPLKKESSKPNTKANATVSVSDSLEFISYQKAEAEEQYVTSTNANREVTYTFSLSHPDSVMGLSLVIDYDETALELADIEDHELFNFQSESANVLLSHVDSTNGLLKLNVANFGPLSNIRDRAIVSLTFESKTNQDSDLIIYSDIRAKNRPSLQQIAQKAISVQADLPETFELSQNYPNPFNPTTSIHYELAEQSRVNLTVYDILGRKVETLLSENGIRPGYYKVDWDASRYASGMYIYVMNIQSASGKHHLISKKMMLIK